MRQKRPLCLESLRRKASRGMWCWSPALRKSGNDRCKGSGSHVEERRGVELFLGTGLRLAWTDGLGRGYPCASYKTVLSSLRTWGDFCGFQAALCPFPHYRFTVNLLIFILSERLLMSSLQQPYDVGNIAGLHVREN